MTANCARRSAPVPQTPAAAPVAPEATTTRRVRLVVVIVVDNLMRSDRALGRFLRELEHRMPIRVLISSDHGAAALPERARVAGRHALRLSGSEIVKTLNQRLPPKAGASPLVAAFTEPFVYLSDAGRSAPDFPQLLQKVIHHITQIDGIIAAYSVAELLAGRAPEDALSKLARASMMAGRGGDIYVVVREHSIIDPRMPGGSGTSHGSPWGYDQLVPVLFYGEGITPRAQRDEIDVLRVAPTLAGLLGVAAPEGATLPSLLEP
jgi:hypothetical protein